MQKKKKERKKVVEEQSKTLRSWPKPLGSTRFSGRSFTEHFYRTIISFFFLLLSNRSNITDNDKNSCYSPLSKRGRKKEVYAQSIVHARMSTVRARVTSSLDASIRRNREGARWKSSRDPLDRCVIEFRGRSRGKWWNLLSWYSSRRRRKLRALDRQLRG